MLGDRQCAMVRGVMVTRTRDEWVTLLGAAGIPCSPLHSLGELSAHAHTAASEMVMQYDHPHLGELNTVAQPVRFDGQRPAFRSAPPMHGQHGMAVLQEAGYDAREIGALAASGAVKLQ